MKFHEFSCRTTWPWGIDARALGLLRVLLGMLALADIHARLAMGLEWYTSSDIEPSSAIHVTDTPHRSPLHEFLFFRGSARFQTAVFAVHIAIAVMYTLGCFTVVTAPALWLATVSMQGRNEAFLDGSDKFFRNVLLWTCFVPLDGVFVLGHSWRRNMNTDRLRQRDGMVYGVGATGLSLQLPLMYLGTVAHRWHTGPCWWPLRGTAVFYAVNGVFASTPFATGVVAGYPHLTYLMTVGAIVAEVAVPVMILLSARRVRFRTVAVVAAVLLQLSIQVLFCLPQWGAVASITAIVYLPPRVLDSLCGDELSAAAQHHHERSPSRSSSHAHTSELTDANGSASRTRRRPRRALDVGNITDTTIVSGGGNREKKSDEVPLLSSNDESGLNNPV